MRSTSLAQWLIILVMVIVAAVAGSVYLSSCLVSDSSHASESAEAAEQATSDLKIISATPQGMIQSIDQFYSVVVVFNMPMVPLQALPEGDGSGPLIIRPAVKGRFRWLGSNTLAFTPTDRLQLASKYDVTIPAGTASMAGAVLRRDFTFSFETTRPSLIKSNIYDDAQGVTIRPSIFLLFSQPMNSQSVADGVRLIHDPTGVAVEMTVKSADSSEITEFLDRYAYSYYYDNSSTESSQNVAGRLFVGRPHRDLDMSTAYRVVVREGIMGLEGRLGMAEQRDWLFRTYGPLTIERFAKPEHPHQAIRMKFSNPVQAGDLRTHVRIKPEVELMDCYELYWDSEYSTSVSFKLEPQTEYEMTIDALTPDQFGNTLGEDQVFHFTTGDFPSRVYFPGGNHVIESHLNHDLHVTAMNPSGMSVNMAKLNVVEAIRLTREDYQWTSVLNFSRWEVTSVLPGDQPRNEQRMLAVDLNPALASATGGIVLVEFWHDQASDTRPQRAMVQVTDIGITAKFSRLHNLIHVSSLKDGKPIRGAKVQILDDEAIIRYSGTTDGDGIVRTPGWEGLSMTAPNKWSEPTQWVLVTHANDEALASSESRLSLYRFNVPWNWDVKKQDRLEAQVFTNQGIYRPGEKVLIKGLVRSIRNDALHVPLSQAVTVHLSNPSYEEIWSRDITANSYGGWDVAFDLDEASPLGHYSIRCTAAGEEIASQSFQVEEFRPVETEVTVTSNQPEYVWGETMKATLDAHYLFGMPMANTEMAWNVTRTKTAFQPSGHEEFFFGDNLEDYYYSWEGRYSYGSVLTSGVATTDERGLVGVTLPLDPGAKNETSTLVLEGTVQDKNRQSVSGRRSMTVHAGAFYIGLKPATTFLSLGQSLSVGMVAVRPAGQHFSGRRITVELVRREWISARERLEDGTFTWTSQMKDSVEATQEMVSRAGIFEVTFTPRSAGYYVIRASGDDDYGNQIRSSTYTYVTGSGYAGWRMNEDDAVDLVTSRASYDPGDKAKILVKSPYEQCRALVTIERDGILSHFTTALEGNSDFIELPVTREMIPNAYVSVVLVKGRTALPTADRLEDLGKPSFKIGYVKLVVNADENRLKVDIQTAKDKFSPGEWVDVNLQVKDRRSKGQSAEVVLYVEDIGVLNLVNYQTPRPFDYFYRHRELGVSTTENRRFILDQVAMRDMKDKGGVGGGGGEEGYASIAIRRNFKSCVYWNPGIVTDASGRANIRFQLPDNLTGFKIIAVAHTRESKFGSAEKNITVAKQLMLRPALPRFARVGDDISAGVIVHNYSDMDDSVSLWASVSGVSLRDDPGRTIYLRKGDAKEVRYRFQVPASGKAILTFKALMNSLSDGVELAIPLRIPSYTETVSLYGSTMESHKEEIIVPGEIYGEYGGLDVRTSATAFVDLDGGMKYLLEYPYGCLEQKTSKALPIILFGDVVRAFGFDRVGDGGPGIEETVRTYLDEVPKYQTYSGGFAYWIGGEYESPYVSVYTMLAMIKAREKGYEVSSECLDRGMTYLKKIVRQTPTDRYGLFYWHITNALALAVLAEAGYFDAPAAELLFQRRDELPVYAQATLLKAVHKGGGNKAMVEELRRRVQNAIKMSSTTAHFEEPMYSGLEYTFHSNIRTTAAVLQVFLEMDGDRVPWAEKVVRHILQERRIGRWRTTQENAYVFWSLGTYFHAFEKENPDFAATVLVDGREVLSEMYQGRTVKTAQNRTSLNDLRKDTKLPLQFMKTGTGRLYYTARLTYAPTVKTAIKPRDEGLAVTKVFSDEAGMPVSQNRFKAGRMYTVTLTVQSAQDRAFVVVDDPLAAGFEAVNVHLATSSSASKYQTTSTSSSSWWWWDRGTFNNSEMRDDRVLLFADRLQRGSHTFTYLVRATSYGTFSQPATKAEEMYNPDVFGTTSNQTMVVE